VEYQKILIEILEAARAKNYAGYSKFDALNSPVLSFLSFNSRWLRLLYTQLVKESPFHIRPLLGVEVSRNPKGIALFARAYLFLYQKTGKPEYLSEAESLIHWLIQNPSPGHKNLCWGYNHDWQNLIFLQKKFEPNAVVSVFVGEALIHMYRVTQDEKYLRAARSVADFILDDLPVLHDSSGERAIAYVLGKVDAVVLNNQVLTGALLVKVWKHTKEDKLLETAIRQMNYTVNRRTENDAWFYTHPSDKSRITHDNYHTGGILDGLLEFYEETGDARFMEIYWKGLEYYQTHLFEPDGAPRWMNDKQYPYDIHGSAQGIISFVKAGRHKEDFLKQAEKITEWAISNLYRTKTHDFAYRQGRFMKWNYSLMRWCNAWMARALAESLDVSWN
jgi:rhamnogalacturonyl hydrolase YesR